MPDEPRTVYVTIPFSRELHNQLTGDGMLEGGLLLQLQPREKADGDTEAVPCDLWMTPMLRTVGGGPNR